MSQSDNNIDLRYTAAIFGRGADKMQEQMDLITKWLATMKNTLTRATNAAELREAIPDETLRKFLGHNSLLVLRQH